MKKCWTAVLSKQSSGDPSHGDQSLLRSPAAKTHRSLSCFERDSIDVDWMTSFDQALSGHNCHNHFAYCPHLLEKYKLGSEDIAANEFEFWI